MESHIKDKHIILGFIGVSICLISMLITLYVAESFNQDNFVRLVVFVCSNLLGWLLYFSFQTVIFDLYEIYKIKSSKKRMHYSTRPIETKQMEYANRRGIPYVVIIGETELASQTATVKDMHSGEQTAVPFAELARYMAL